MTEIPPHAVSNAPLLRPYEKADLPALYALDQVCFPPEIAYSRHELKYFFVHPRYFTIVAEDRGQLVGFIVTELVMGDGRRNGHIITIDVVPGARRSGTGTLLMRHVERLLDERGAVNVVLEVAADNRGACSFYARLGFEPVGRIPGYYGGKTDAVSMQKLLRLDMPKVRS